VTAVRCGRATALWLPCRRDQFADPPAVKGEVLALRPRVRVAGVRVAVTGQPTLSSLGVMSVEQAQAQGYGSVQEALDAWRDAHGTATGDTLAWERVGAGLTPAPPTPPDVRVRIRRFASCPGGGGRARRTR
jgi:hypothetical protein